MIRKSHFFTVPSRDLEFSRTCDASFACFEGVSKMLENGFPNASSVNLLPPSISMILDIDNPDVVDVDLFSESYELCVGTWKMFGDE